MAIYKIYSKSKNINSSIYISLTGAFIVLKEGMKLKYSLPFLCSALLLLKRSWMGAITTFLLSLLFMKIATAISTGFMEGSTSIPISLVRCSEYLILFIMSLGLSHIGSLFEEKTLLKRGFSMIFEAHAKNPSEAIRKFSDSVTKSDNVIFNI